MAASLVFILAVMGQSPESATIAELVRNLASKAADERIAASEGLLEWGAAAIPALDAAAHDPDRDVQLAAKDLLKQIAAQPGAPAFHPKAIRASVEIVDQPFGEALAELSRAFYVKCPAFEPQLADRRVSCRVERATLWEALSIFCKAARCEQFQYLYSLRREQWKDPCYQVLDIEGMRVYLESGVASLRESDFMVSLSLPPGTLVTKAELADLTVRDDKGTIQKILTDGFGDEDFKCERAPGVPTSVRVPRFSIKNGSLKHGSTLTLEGKLKLHFPEKVETLAAWDAKRPTEMVIRGVKITPEWDADRKEMFYKLKVRAGKDPVDLYLGSWNADGTRLPDLGPYRYKPSENRDATDSQNSDACPSKVEAWTVTKTSVQTVPIKFSNVHFNN